MKKSTINLSILCLALSLTVRAQNVEFLSGKSAPGQDIVFTYKPANDLAGAEKVTVVVYAFEDGTKLKATEGSLVPSDDLFKGSVSTTENTKVVYLKFVSGDKADFNNKAGYKTKMYTSAGKPVKGAMAALAEIHNSSGQWYLDMENDSKRAYEYLMEEFKQYPESKEEHLPLYAACATANDDQQALSEIRSHLDKLASKKKPSEDELMKIYVTRLRLGDKASAEAMQQRMIKDYPKGKAAMNVKFDSFYKETDLAAKEKLFKQMQSSLSEAQRNSMTASLASKYGQTDIAKFEMYAGMITSKTTLANIYNSIAWSMSGERIEGEAKEIDRALALSGKSLELIKSSIGSDEGKPDFMTSTQWKKNLEGTYGMFADTYALLSYKKGEYADALSFQELYNKYGYPDAEANERYVVYLEKVNGNGAALEAMAKFIVDGNSTQAMKEKFTSMLASLPADEAAARSLAFLEIQAREKLKKEVEKQMIDTEAPGFTLKDLVGNEVSLESLKGKTVVIDFWATWCGPCIASFPGMQQAVNKYKDDASVRFLFVDSWENGENDKKLESVSKFISNKGYTFDVLMDYDDKVIKSYDVAGIPTKFVVGPDGRVKFKKIGGGAADKLMEELYIMIDLAKAAQPQEVSVLSR
jgi:thiol-disulfide isomerase/thioredoxin